VEVFILTKKVNLSKFIRNNRKYDIKTNPVDVIFGRITKSFFNESQQREIDQVEDIIEQELNEDFTIGGHPKYDELLCKVKSYEDFSVYRVSDVKLCSIFVDLRNFTKRALFIDSANVETIDDIANLKQKAISTWIKLARYYNGHIHSITGDGLMVLMDKLYEEDDDWTIGARSLLFSLRVLESADILNDYLKEFLKERGKEQYANNPHNLINIKIGIEYSPKTLMNPQGVIVNDKGENKAVGEVKATSFEVDFSAKVLSEYKNAYNGLDANGPKNNRLIMFGNQYKELMQFLDSEIEVKKVASYERTMYDVPETRDIYSLDTKPIKRNILTIEDVADICDVEEQNEDFARASIKALQDSGEIKHGN
jgi:hypothetical protein